jgi:NADH-quinone oxidoreductase subunit K
MVSLNHYLILAASLFTIGVLGFLIRRNMLIILMSIELMLNGVNLTLIAFNRFHVTSHTGHIFAFFIMAVAAAEVAVGLAIVISLFRLRRTVNVDEADFMRH